MNGISDVLRYYPPIGVTDQQAEALEEIQSDELISLERIDCMNCTSSSSRLLFTNDRYGAPCHTVMCRHCGLLYTNPRLDPSSAKYLYESGLYRRLYGGGKPEDRFRKSQAIDINDRSGVSEEKYDADDFFYFIHGIGLEYVSVCEVGCGSGYNLNPFQRLGKTVVGYEPDERLVNKGLDYGINVRQGLVDEVEGIHDLLIMKHVLEHLHDPMTVLRKLRPHIGQYLFIEVPGAMTLMPSIQQAHNFYFSVNTLLAMATKTGFRCDKVMYYADNNYIMALFRKDSDARPHEYSYRWEIYKNLMLYGKFQGIKAMKAVVRSCRQLGQ